MAETQWAENMARSLEKWGPKTDRSLRMVAVPINSGDIWDALAEMEALRLALETATRERDRLSMQIIDAFTYFKESQAEQFCQGPEPTLVYQLVEQLFDAYKRVASNALHVAGEAKRLRADRDIEQGQRVVWQECAVRLERERDEARAERDRAAEIAVREALKTNAALAERDALLSKRDAPREFIAHCQHCDAAVLVSDAKPARPAPPPDAATEAVGARAEAFLATGHCWDGPTCIEALEIIGALVGATAEQPKKRQPSPGSAYDLPALARARQKAGVRP